MTLVNFNIQSDSFGFQLIDVLCAYHQSICDKFQSNVNFKVSKEFDPCADVNVYCKYLPQTIDYADLEKYQLILLTNSCEPLVVSSPKMVECLNRLDNCYLICNSLLTTDHNLHSKVIWFPANLLECRKLWTEHFYPYALENASNSQQQRNKGMLFINGNLRAHRHHFVEEMKKRKVDVPVMTNISTVVQETNDVDLHESDEDTQFKEWVNEFYGGVIVRNYNSGFWDRFDVIGLNGKFGQWSIAYRVIEEYFQYRCIIFPESTWQNNEMSITEKSLKCFFSGSLPWPIGGSNLNWLYNQTGFYTAWNVLPPELQKFDSILDHRERYHHQITAIDWLSKNLDVLDRDSTKKMIASNRNLFYNNNAITLEFVKKFDQILKKYIP